MPEPPRFDPDLEWLDLVRSLGLVVAPSLLKELGLTQQLQTRADNAAVAELLRSEDEEGPALSDPWAFVERILGWPKARVAGAPGGPALPEDLCKVLPEYDTVLEPHWAVAGLDDGWQLLVRVESPGIKPDARGALAGWEATPHQRFERLLRDTQIPIGVLITDKELRLVYAPHRETSGWTVFPLRPLAPVAGRPMLGGLKLMLDSFRPFNDAENRRLPALLKASRDAQTTVSTTLAEQVVGALHELLRGLTAAEPKLITTLATERPQHLYEGLLTVLMRLVFILYAEDRDLIPSRTDEKARALYDQGYSVRGPTRSFWTTRRATRTRWRSGAVRGAASLRSSASFMRVTAPAGSAPAAASCSIPMPSHSSKGARTRRSRRASPRSRIVACCASSTGC
jgi:hypothetical protein